MLRSLLAVYGIIVAAVPRRVIGFWEPLAFETAGDTELRSWIVPLTRLLGCLYVLAALRARRRDHDGPETATNR